MHTLDQDPALPSARDWTGLAPVPWNAWDHLTPPPLGGWSPSERVSVVLPCYRGQAELERTVAALAVQSYPRELTEVLVVDDGSDPPILAPVSGTGLDLRVLRQPRDGFGAARARNLGAGAAKGSILVFLDADMIPDREHLEAHARWHHVCPYAVTLGPRRHVAVDDLTPDRIGTAVASERGMAGLLHGRPQEVPAWLEAHYRRTDGLRGAHDDLFRVVTSGNLGIGAATFAQVGGFDASFDRWGGEDTELGYRLFTAGGLLVPEPAARCWHQGTGHEPSVEELRSLDEQRARLAHLIAHRGFRRLTRGRSYAVPRVVAEITVADARREHVVATVESLLAAELNDLLVHVPVPEDHPQRDWLHHHLDGDPRIRLAAGGLPDAAPVRARIPAGVLLPPPALDRLLAELADVSEPVGLVEVTVPGRDPRQARVQVWLTRAAARLRAAGQADQPDAVAELYGGRWVSGYELGLRDVDVAPAELTVPDPVASDRAGDGQQDALELWSSLGRLPAAQRRAVLAAARQAVTTMRPRELAVLLRLAGTALRVRRSMDRLRPRRVVAGLRRRAGRLPRRMRTTV